jgi:two-component system, LytTR family, response regulator LytT
MDILIVEDDVIWRGQIQLMLEETFANAEVNTAHNFDEAATKIAARTPDVVIADIMLQDKRSFDLFVSVSRTYPVVFITAYPQHNYLQQVLSLPNTTFLVKPFHALSLAAAINILLKSADTTLPGDKKFLEVFGKFKQKQAVYFDEILYIKADGNYAKLYTKNQRVYSLKLPLRDLLLKADEYFLRIHKSVAINTTFVKRLDLSNNMVRVDDAMLPVGRAYRKNTIEVLSKILG